MKALIFDVDDTLYDQIQPFQKALEKHLEVAETLLEPIYIASRKYSDEAFEAVNSGEMTLQASHIYRLQRALADFEIEISSEEALTVQADYSRYQGQLTLAPEFRDVFAYCQQANITMGVITNGPHQHQLKKIKSLDLFRWIPQENVLISGAVGLAKPSREIFDLLAKKLQLIFIISEILLIMMLSAVLMPVGNLSG
ncbi:HAD family hydrolase [Streptococcus caviae]|uniref:HAD family hydrolase n=1 Tax=Streptococcus sp. 'caviae' TaxID=1915004 RepID=UPI000A9B8B02|nr:HAD family hydrolase [Streptococcus sp. 'caviae']